VNTTLGSGVGFCRMDVAIMNLYTSAGSCSKGQASQAQWRVIVIFACCTALLLVAAPLQMVQAADADPLQDFCVADLSPSAPRVNGFPCKDRANVTSKDFLFTGFRKAGSILNLELLRNGYKYYANNKLVKNLAHMLCYVISRTGQLPCWQNTVDVTSSLAPSLDTGFSVRKSAHSDLSTNCKTFSTNCMHKLDNDQSQDPLTYILQLFSIQDHGILTLLVVWYFREYLHLRY